MYLLVAFGVALTAGLAQPSSAASGPKPAVLTQTVTISGSQTGYVPVTVARDMKLGNPFVTKHRGAVKVTGGGDAAGFALIKDGLQGPILLGGKSKAYLPYNEMFGIAVNSLIPNPDDGAEFAVPAGDYRLYLVTGGKPTTVTLKFLGGSGSSRLAPTTKVESVVQQVNLTAPVPGPVGGVYSGGGAVTLTTPVLQFSLSRLDTSAHTESVQQYCYFLGDKPTGPQPYGPPCAAPGDDRPVLFAPSSIFVISDEGVGPQSFYGFSSSLTTDISGDPVKADIAFGTNYTTAGVVTSGDYTQYWLSLDAAPKAAAPTKPAAGPASQQPPQEQPPGAAGPGTATETLPVTGLPAPALAVAPLLLLAAAAARRARSAR